MRAASGEPIVLALDSAGLGCSVLVAVGETVLAVERSAAMHGQAERLLPMVDTVVRKSGLSPAALDIVATTTGPGSFTGIRVGLAAVRGIALATGWCDRVRSCGRRPCYKGLQAWRRSTPRGSRKPPGRALRTTLRSRLLPA